MSNFFKNDLNKELDIEKAHSRYNYLLLTCIAEKPITDLPSIIISINFDYIIEKKKKSKQTNVVCLLDTDWKIIEPDSKNENKSKIESE